MVSTSVFKHLGLEGQCKIRPVRREVEATDRSLTDSHDDSAHHISLVITGVFPAALFGPHQTVQSSCHRFYYHHFCEWKGRMTGREDVDRVYAWISLCGLSKVYKYYCIFCIVLTYCVIKITNTS